METMITARHGEIADILRTRAERVMERLARLAARPTAAHVTFGLDHQRSTVEIRLIAARDVIHVASADAADHRTALDRAVAKLRRQLDKQEANPRRKAGTARR